MQTEHVHGRLYSFKSQVYFLKGGWNIGNISYSVLNPIQYNRHQWLRLVEEIIGPNIIYNLVFAD